MSLPEIISAAEWRQAQQRLLVKEKQATRERDALAAARRRMPMTEIDKDYVFEGPDGRRRLVDLFEGRQQLLLYHFMFAPGVDGWPEAGRDGCSMFVDQVTDLAHLHARDTSMALISRAPIERIEAYRKRMGWEIPWLSSEGSDFNRDFEITTDEYETFALSVFLRDEDRVFRTYEVRNRGVESLGPLWSLLDLTPLGRQERWEESPPGAPQTEPYAWWRRHDEYEPTAVTR